MLILSCFDCLQNESMMSSVKLQSVFLWCLVDGCILSWSNSLGLELLLDSEVRVR